MSLLGRGITVVAGAGLAVAGYSFVDNSTEVIANHLHANDKILERTVSKGFLESTGRLAMDNFRLVGAGLEELQVPLVDVSENSVKSTPNTFKADTFGVVMGLGGSALLGATGLGAIGYGLFRKKSFDQSDKLVDAVSRR